MYCSAQQFPGACVFLCVWRDSNVLRLDLELLFSLSSVLKTCNIMVIIMGLFNHANITECHTVARVSSHNQALLPVTMTQPLFQLSQHTQVI